MSKPKQNQNKRNTRVVSSSSESSSSSEEEEEEEESEGSDFGMFGDDTIIRQKDLKKFTFREESDNEVRWVIRIDLTIHIYIYIYIYILTLTLTPFYTHISYISYNNPFLSPASLSLSISLLMCVFVFVIIL